MRITRNDVKVAAMLAMVLTFVALGSIQYALADGGIEPPPLGANEKQHGPAINGVISLDGTNATFSGKCKGVDVNVGPIAFPANLANVTEQTMTNVRLPGSGPAGCFKKDSPGGEETIINTVNKLTKFGSPTPTHLTADVTLQFIVTQ